MTEPSASEYQSDTVIFAAGRFGGTKPPGPPLQPPSGGGTFDGMEARVAKLEATVDHIQRDVGDIRTEVRTLRENARSDFRILFGAIIASTLGLAGLIAKGFQWF